ncbi:MAG: M23 family metallopeptidase [Bacilli bacterium]|nr:M23 family metallopeptidase [Bacilli bacterium]
MTKKRLKDWVIPTLGLIVLMGTLLLYHIIGSILNDNLVPEDTLFVDIIQDNEETIDVQKEVQVKAIKPYTDNTVKISKYYYSSKDEETKQQQSLIKYENIYMPNTGILYSSDKEFNTVSTLNGKVITVKEDEILGNIVEIEHENNIVTIYQSIKDINVKVGDTIKQGDLIAKSGPNKLENEKENCLHFEVYQEGNLINPETLYNLELSK